MAVFLLGFTAVGLAFLIADSGQTSSAVKSNVPSLASQAARADQQSSATRKASLGRYRQAAFDTADCMNLRFSSAIRDAGLVGIAVLVPKPTVTKDEFYVELPYTVEFSEGAPDREKDGAELMRAATDIETACRREHLDSIEASYHKAFMLDYTALDTATEGFKKCLLGRGVMFANNAQPETVREMLLEKFSSNGTGEPDSPDVDAVMSCGTAYPSIFAVPG